jgi:hypothetical protein
MSAFEGKADMIQTRRNVRGHPTIIAVSAGVLIYVNAKT